jgi:zinc transporter ZupT
VNLFPAFVVFGIGLAGAMGGGALEQAPRAARRMLLVSGGALLVIALFWVAPEIAEQYGWLRCFTWMAAGFGLLWAIDKFLWPLCPSCSHTHDHAACASPLHGLALPLIIASGVHSFFDGWGLMTAQETSAKLELAFVLGVGVHKVFEGIALGAILRASVRTWPRILGGAAAAQGMTVVGGIAALWISAAVDTSWFAAFLGIAGGSFLYLGYHTIEAEMSRRSAVHQHHEPDHHHA